MKNSFRIFFGAVLLALTTISNIQASEQWGTDYNKAITQAKEENKDLLLLFTGSDWCAACIRLEENILSKKNFYEEVQKHFVLVMLDYPSKKENKDKMPKATQKQNEQLKNKFQISGYPSLYLVETSGKPYAQAELQHAKSIESYLKHILALREKRNSHIENFKKLENSTGTARATLLDMIISGSSEQMQSTSYKKEMQEIIDLDMNNKLGLRLKYQLKLWPIKAGDMIYAEEFNYATALINRIINELNPNQDVHIGCLNQLARIHNVKYEFKKQRDKVKQIVDLYPQTKSGIYYRSWLKQYWPEQLPSRIAGKIDTDMRGYKSMASAACDEDQTVSYFCISGPQKDNHFTFTFNEPSDVKEIQIYSASLYHGGYSLRNCSLEISTDGKIFETIQTFGNRGTAASTVSVQKKGVVCVRLRITKDVNSWLHLRELICVPMN